MTSIAPANVPAWARAVSPPARAGVLNVLTGVLLILALLPLATAVADSFTTPEGRAAYVQWWGGGRPAPAVADSRIAPDGRSAFARWWDSHRGWSAMGRSVALAALAASLAVALAWAMSACAAALPARWALLAAMLSCLPILVPASLVATAWIDAFGKQGTLRGPLRALGLGELSVFSLPAAAAAMATRYFGLAVLLLLHERLRQREAWPAERAFRIPYLRRALGLRLRGLLRPAVAGWLLVALFCLNDHILPDLLLIRTYGTQVLIQYSALMDPSGAASLTVPIAGLGVGMILLAGWLGRGQWKPSDRPAIITRRPNPRWLYALALGGAAALLAIPLALPVAVLAGQTSLRVMGEVLFGRGDNSAGEQLGQTLWLAAIGGPACATLAAVLAGRWVSSWRRGRRSLVPLVLLNLTVPATLLAVGVTRLVQRPALRFLADGHWPLLAAYVARFLPVAVLLFYLAWRSQPAEGELAGRVHGVPRWRLALRVLLPRRRATLLAAAVLVAVLIAVELEMSILLAPPGGGTLGVRLYSLIHTAPAAIVSGLTLDILLLTVPGLALLAGLVLRRRGLGST